jgi:hypothetical protein
MAGNQSIGHSMAMILAPWKPYSSGHALADVLVAGNLRQAQAKSSVVKFAKQQGSSQANAQIHAFGVGKIGQARVTIT